MCAATTPNFADPDGMKFELVHIPPEAFASSIMGAPMTAYAELQTLTNFTFLQGASHPQELAIAAAALGISAFAVTDRNTLAGVVRLMRGEGAGVLHRRRAAGSAGRRACDLSTDRAAYGRLSSCSPSAPPRRRASAI
jgi:hypothetical protein